MTPPIESLSDTERWFAQAVQQHAHTCLEPVVAAAEHAGVACETVLVTHTHPWAEIVRTAQERHCDLIVMASHARQGRRAKPLIGSEPQKVLTHIASPCSSSGRRPNQSHRGAMQCMPSCARPHLLPADLLLQHVGQ
jgi:hypothetical protein